MPCVQIIIELAEYYMMATPSEAMSYPMRAMPHPGRQVLFCSKFRENQPNGNLQVAPPERFNCIILSVEIRAAGSPGEPWSHSVGIALGFGAILKC